MDNCLPSEKWCPVRDAKCRGDCALFLGYSEGGWQQGPKRMGCALALLVPVIKKYAGV